MADTTTQLTQQSFNATIKNIVQPQVEAGILAGWTMEGDQLLEFFKLEDRENKEASIRRIAESASGFAENSPEKYLARMIVAGITKFPFKLGSGLTRQRVYVSDAQKAHDELKKAAFEAIESFIEQNEFCKRLKSLTVQKNGENIFIHPVVHMRNSRDVLNAYETNGAQIAQSAPEEAQAATPPPPTAIAETATNPMPPPPPAPMNFAQPEPQVSPPAPQGQVVQQPLMPPKRRKKKK